MPEEKPIEITKDRKELEMQELFDTLPVFSAPIPEDKDGAYTFVADIEDAHEYMNKSYLLGLSAGREEVKKALDETLVTYKDMPMFAPRKDGKPNWEGLWSLTMELQMTKRKKYLDKLITK